MYTQNVIVLDTKCYSVIKIRHSHCLHPIEEEREGMEFNKNSILFL